MLCLEWDYLATHDTNNFEYQTIIFAVQNDQNAKDTNQQIIGGIQQFIGKLASTQNIQKHYSLLTFDDKNTENVINTVDTAAFVSKLTEKLNQPTSSTGKKVQALYTMQLATEISVYKPTIVYVFLNADTNIGQPLKILEALSREF